MDYSQSFASTVCQNYQSTTEPADSLYLHSHGNLKTGRFAARVLYGPMGLIAYRKGLAILKQTFKIVGNDMDFLYLLVD